MPLTQGSELLKRTASDSFWGTYYDIPDPFDGMLEVKPSTQITETYPRLGAAPMPEEWVGGANVKAVPELTFSITNKPWAAGVKVGKKHIKYQQWDTVGRLVSNLGRKARDHKVKKLSDLMNAGGSTVGDDGQFFFDTDHADPGASYTTSQDNDLTSNINPLAPTDLEMAAAIRGMFDAFWAFKDDQGDPMVPSKENAESFVLMVPPMYRSKAHQVRISESLTGPVGNDLQGLFTVRTNPFLTTPSTTGQMFMFYIGGSHKPLIVQETGGVELHDTAMTDEGVLTGDVAYVASWWGETGYGQWRTAVMHTFT